MHEKYFLLLQLVTLLSEKLLMVKVEVVLMMGYHGSCQMVAAGV